MDKLAGRIVIFCAVLASIILVFLHAEATTAKGVNFPSCTVNSDVVKSFPEYSEPDKYGKIVMALVGCSRLRTMALGEVGVIVLVGIALSAVNERRRGSL